MASGSPAPEAKAATFNSQVAVIRGLVQRDAFERLVKELEPATQALVLRPPVAMAWIPHEHLRELHVTALRCLFDDRLEMATEIGRRAVLHDLNTAYRLLIKLCSPGFVIARAARMWAQYTRNNGEVSAERIGGTVAEIHYRGVRTAAPCYWEFQRGALLAIAAATGYRTIRIDLLSGGGHSGNALFRAEWQERRPAAAETPGEPPAP